MILPHQMDDDHLIAGLEGAMQWQRIVQDRNYGPYASKEAATTTNTYGREAVTRGVI